MAITGCGAFQPLVTVVELISKCDAFRGKPINLAGYLGECSVYSCHLYPDPVGMAAADEYMRALSSELKLAVAEKRPASSTSLGPKPRSIGMGGGAEFDRKAAQFQNSYVVISGRVAKATCTGEGGTDRSAGLEPTAIRAMTSAELDPGPI
ncbi:MAG: hypothetical protein EOP58_01035 [Sphingomonadales bacterium]|nr:MAG: hypothetical protein EOP58_01035 [Sphingomonadales bacterium]